MNSKFSKETQTVLRSLNRYVRQSHNINENKINSISLDNPYIKDLYKKAFRKLVLIEARKEYANQSKQRLMNMEFYQGKLQRRKSEEKKINRLTQSIMKRTGKTAAEILSCDCKPKKEIKIEKQTNVFAKSLSASQAEANNRRTTKQNRNPMRLKYHEMTDEERLMAQNAWTNKQKRRTRPLPKSILKKSTPELKTWLKI